MSVEMQDWRDKSLDVAYVFEKADAGEVISVGEVVALVGHCLTKDPRKEHVSQWHIVANLPSTSGFLSDLGIPRDVRNPLLCESDVSVAVATQGLTVVFVQGPCVKGAWVVASSKNDGFAKQENGTEDSKLRLGQVEGLIGDMALVHVRPDDVGVLNPPLDAEKPKDKKVDDDARTHGRRGDALAVQSKFEYAADEFAIGAAFVLSSLVTRALLEKKRACCFMELQKWKKAAKHAMASLEFVATDAEAHFVLAQACANLQDFSKARSEMDSVLAIRPNNVAYQNWLLDLLGRMREAFVGGSTRKDLDPISFGHINKTGLRHRHGNVFEKWFGKVGKEDSMTHHKPGSWTDILSKMEQLMRSGNFEEAISFGENHLEENHAGVMFNLGTLFGRGLGTPWDERRALVCFRKAADVPDVGPPDDEQRSHGVWRVVGVAEAKAALAESYQHGTAEAAQDSTEALRLAFESASAGCKAGQNTYGNLLYARGRYLEAFEFYQMACDGDPASGGSACAAALSNLGHAFLKGHGTRQSLRRALGCYQKSVEKGIQKDVEVVEMVKGLLIKHGDKETELELSKGNVPAELKGYLDVLFGLDVKSGHPSPGSSKVFRDPKLLFEYAHASSYAQALAQACCVWFHGIDCLLHEKGRDEDAIMSEMAKALELDEKVCYPWPNLDPIIENLVKRTLTRDPLHRLALILKGWTLSTDANKSRWIDWSRHCVELHPKDPYFLCTLGQALGFAGRFKESIRTFRKAIKERPDADIFYCLGKSLRHLVKQGSDISEAERAYATFLELAPADQRSRPHALYDIAWMRFVNNPEMDRKVLQGLIDKALEEEKNQLPFFLPIECLPKDNLLKLCLMPNKMAQSLKEGLRRQQILAAFNDKSSVGLVNELMIFKPEYPALMGWSSLNEIVFLDFVPQSDKIHAGCLLSLKIVTNVKVRGEFLHFVAEDANNDVEVILLRSRNLTLSKGKHIQIAHPYQRMSLDMRSMVRIDDPNNFKIVLRCNHCNTLLEQPLACSVCGSAFYCNKEHQTLDWAKHKHSHKK
jgi:tetratricopeptide (TPR) repeat protein